MTSTKPLAVLLLGAAIGSGVAYAHDDAYLATLKAPNGGELRMAGPYHFELVVARDARPAAESPVAVYVTDHAGQKMPVAGAKGTATFLGGGANAAIALTPEGDNGLKGRGRYAADPAMKVVVAVSFADGKTEQARFEPFKGDVAGDAKR